jgi:hypothetical protein
MLSAGRLKRLRPASADFWVEAREAVVVEGVDHSSHMRLVV